MAVLKHLPAVLAAGAAALLSACGNVPLNEERVGPMPAPGAQTARTPRIDHDLPVLPRAGSGRGGYYQDDGPGDNPPADLRSAALTLARGAVTVRDIELAFGGGKPRPGEAVPTVEGLTPAIAAAQASVPALAPAMQAGLQAVQGMVAALDQHLGAGRSPDLKPLLALLRAVASAGQQAQGTPAFLAAASIGAPDPTAAPAAATAVPGAINSRDDAIRMLQRVSDWIESNEPTNPAPLFIKRAQRLMTKNFLEIIRDLMPDGVGQIEKLAGSPK